MYNINNIETSVFIFYQFKLDFLRKYSYRNNQYYIILLTYIIIIKYFIYLIIIFSFKNYFSITRFIILL